MHSQQKIKFLKIFDDTRTHLIMRGIVAGLGHAPISIPMFFIFGIVAFIDKMKTSLKESYKTMFFYGWLFGVFYYVTSLYWISVAIFADLENFWWAFPFALFGIPSFLALWFGAVAVTFKFLNDNGIIKKNRAYAIAILLSLAEYSQSFMFTGFPWNLAAYSIERNIFGIQFVSVIGSYGFGFIAYLFAACLYNFIFRYTYKGLEKLLIGLVVIFSLTTYGYFRIKESNQSPTWLENSPTLLLVQPSIPQDIKWDPRYKRQNVDNILTISNAIGKRADYIIWPETAVPVLWDEDSYYRNYILQKLPENSKLIFGLIRRKLILEKIKINDNRENNTTKPKYKRSLKFFNSIYMVDSKSGIPLMSYNKSHLVPFGEYVPFRDMLPSYIRDNIPMIYDFSPGSGVESYSPDGIIPPFTPLICYEVIFPSEVLNQKNANIKWFLNITNDAWYGNTSGPYQHLTSVKFRAIETGKPIIRVANNGISAVIDKNGRILKKLPYNKVGFIETKIPTAYEKPTIYSKYGDSIYFAMIMIVLLLIIIF